MGMVFPFGFLKPIQRTAGKDIVPLISIDVDKQSKISQGAFLALLSTFGIPIDGHPFKIVLDRLIQGDESIIHHGTIRFNDRSASWAMVA
jgi:hypothetical protein